VPGSFSRLLAELAAAPREPMRAAWTRGFQPGQVIGDRFELVEPLGRGGFGVVLRARDLELRREVAFKALPPGGTVDEGTLREAEVAAQLQHDNLVRLYDHGRCESGAYLIFELLDGETLAARLRRGSLQLAEALRIAVDVTRALIHAHAQGVLHRDLKPSNVFLTEGGRAKVLDFGLAYLFGDGPARSGTPGYMAPEQRRGGSEDPRTDLYAVGVLLREMLTGRPPSASGDPAASGAEGPQLPRKVTTLLERTTAPEPARRPADAASLAAELEGLLLDIEEARRRRVRLAILAAMACAGALVGAAVAQTIGDWRSQPVVAMADLENATGDAELQGLGGLLATSLEQWPRLSIVPRQRLLSLAGDPPRLLCDQARRVASRTGARAVLCGRLVRDDAGYALEFEALDPADGARLAPPIRETAATREDVLPLVDRLSARIRRALLSPLPWPAAASISGMTTASMDALSHYFKGVECAERPAHGQDCAVELRRALEIDPGFGLAAYRLATWLHWFGGAREEQRTLVDRARRSEASLPDKERALLRAWADRLDGRDDEALDLLVRASRIWPQDPEPSYQAADLLRHLDRLAEAIPWFERAIALQPDHAWALGGLVQCLGPLRREADLRGWAARWEAEPRPGTLHALSLARGWLGDVTGAQEAARAALLLGAGPPALEDLMAAKVFAGDLAGVEADLRRLTLRGSPIRRMGFYGLAAVEAYRERPRAALEELDALEREVPEVARDAVYRAIRADLLLGQGEAAAVWREVEAARRIDPQLAAEHAVSLAWLGDVEHARLLAADLPADGPLAATTAALVRFRSGDLEGGLADLRRISAATPVFSWRIAPLFLYGELLAEAGRDAEAVDVLQRAQALYLPLAMWRSWAYPRSLLLVARSNEGMGRRSEVRQAIERLLAAWTQAEAGAPDVAAAHELQMRMAGAQGAGHGEK
jgi:serine/threonine protein kinase